MQEYFGKSAKTYKQTNGKQIILNPAIELEVPVANTKGMKFLDVGCGNGDFAELAKRKGYEYYGFDYSADMVKIAKENFPKADIRQLDAKKFANAYNRIFDVILLSMLFTTYTRRQDIAITLSESAKLLSDGGIIVIGTAHPCYDPYMQKGMLNRSDIEANFTDYYNSGERFIINKDIDGNIFRFEDYHWTLSDYVQSITDSGLKLRKINECKPDITKKTVDRLYYESKKQYPTFILLVCTL